MRKILSDDAEYQVQTGDDGTSYHYRKDYLYKGDRKEEYTLVLLWARKAAGKDAGHDGETVRSGP